MSARHLLPCSCGHEQPVAASQAGGTVTCAACGNPIDVPKLSGLKQLPLEAEPAKTGGGWSFRLGVLSFGVILAAALAAGAGYVASNEPPAPPDFSAEARAEQIEFGLENKTPTELWELYTRYYSPMTKLGIQRHETPQALAAKEAIALSQAYQKALLYAAGGVLALSLVSFGFLPK